MCGEVVLALVIALLGVVVMVQSGQTVSTAVHVPQVFTGLVVLAIATSLPNTVVARRFLVATASIPHLERTSVPIPTLWLSEILFSAETSVPGRTLPVRLN